MVVVVGSTVVSSFNETSISFSSNSFSIAGAVGISGVCSLTFTSLANNPAIIEMSFPLLLRLSVCSTKLNPFAPVDALK